MRNAHLFAPDSLVGNYRLDWYAELLTKLRLLDEWLAFAPLLPINLIHAMGGLREGSCWGSQRGLREEFLRLE